MARFGLLPLCWEALLNLKCAKRVRFRSWSVLVPPDTLDTKFWNPNEAGINGIPGFSHLMKTGELKRLLPVLQLHLLVCVWAH